MTPAEIKWLKGQISIMDARHHMTQAQIDSLLELIELRLGTAALLSRTSSVREDWRSLLKKHLEKAARKISDRDPSIASTLKKMVDKL